MVAAVGDIAPVAQTSPDDLRLVRVRVRVRVMVRVRARVRVRVRVRFRVTVSLQTCRHSRPLLALSTASKSK